MTQKCEKKNKQDQTFERTKIAVKEIIFKVRIELLSRTKLLQMIKTEEEDSIAMKLKITRASLKMNNYKKHDLSSHLRKNIFTTNCPNTKAFYFG